MAAANWRTLKKIDAHIHILPDAVHAANPDADDVWMYADLRQYVQIMRWTASSFTRTIPGWHSIPTVHSYPNAEDDLSAAKRIVKTAERYPDLKLIVSHMGAFQWERLLPLACYVDLSAILPDYARRYGVEGTNALLRKFGPRRLLFATDFPASRSLRPEEIYTVYCGILDQMDFTPEEAAGIAYKNAVGLLG